MRSPYTLLPFVKRATAVIPTTLVYVLDVMWCDDDDAGLECVCVNKFPFLSHYLLPVFIQDRSTAHRLRVQPVWVYWLRCVCIPFSTHTNTAPHQLKREMIFLKECQICMRLFLDVVYGTPSTDDDYDDHDSCEFSLNCLFFVRSPLSERLHIHNTLVCKKLLQSDASLNSIQIPFIRPNNWNSFKCRRNGNDDKCRWFVAFKKILGNYAKRQLAVQQSNEDWNRFIIHFTPSGEQFN